MVFIVGILKYIFLCKVKECLRYLSCGNSNKRHFYIVGFRMMKKLFRYQVLENKVINEVSFKFKIAYISFFDHNQNKTKQGIGKCLLTERVSYKLKDCKDKLIARIN